MFVTGGGRGFIAAHVVRALDDAGYDVGTEWVDVRDRDALTRAIAGAEAVCPRRRALQLHRAGGGDRGGQRRRHGERDRRVPRRRRPAPRAHELVRDVRAGAGPRGDRGGRRRRTGSSPSRTSGRSSRPSASCSRRPPTGSTRSASTRRRRWGRGTTTPTPTGAMVRGVASGRYRASLRGAGLNLVDVHDVARGHVLALERGPGRRALHARRRDVTLTEAFALIARAAGRRAAAARSSRTPPSRSAAARAREPAGGDARAAARRGSRPRRPSASSATSRRRSSRHCAAHVENIR